MLVKREEKIAKYRFLTVRRSLQGDVGRRPAVDHGPRRRVRQHRRPQRRRAALAAPAAPTALLRRPHHGLVTPHAPAATHPSERKRQACERVDSDSLCRRNLDNITRERKRVTGEFDADGGTRRFSLFKCIKC